MEEDYNFSLDWENDLLVDSCLQNTPSPTVIEAIVDYAMMVDIYSKTLDERISICLN